MKYAAFLEVEDADMRPYRRAKAAARLVCYRLRRVARRDGYQLASQPRLELRQSNFDDSLGLFAEAEVEPIPGVTPRVPPR